MKFIAALALIGAITKTDALELQTLETMESQLQTLEGLELQGEPEDTFKKVAEVARVNEFRLWSQVSPTVRAAWLKWRAENGLQISDTSGLASNKDSAVKDGGDSSKKDDSGKKDNSGGKSGGGGGGSSGGDTKGDNLKSFLENYYKQKGDNKSGQQRRVSQTCNGGNERMENETSFRLWTRSHPSKFEDKSFPAD